MKPKLKVGDTFIYTKEMNEAKKKTEYAVDMQDKIGTKQTIRAIHQNERYDLMSNGVCDFHVIDDHLPTFKNCKYIGKNSELISVTPKPQPRKWTVDTTVKSDDGLEISEEQITLFYKGEKFTILEAKTVYKQLGAALKIHKRYFNNDK